MSDDRLEITVLTWPPLWQYWPAYLAMARTETELPGLSFNLRLPPGKVITDVAIRQAFFREMETNLQVMALCEPHELEIPGRAGEPSAMIRRLPVLLRQPLWLVGKTRFFVGPDSYVARNSAERRADASTMPAQVWTYPEGTTSGNFARGMIRRLRTPDGFSGPVLERDLDGGLSEERALAAALGENEFLATFTPWHSILERPRLKGDMLFGPSSEITALQFADVSIAFDERMVQEVVAAHLVGVLNEMSETQGVDAWLKEHVATNWQSVQQFMSRSPGFAWLEALNEAETSVALREYTLLGCYFPYRAMNSALTVEIQKRVLDVFDAARVRAAAEMSRTVSDFVPTPLWGELTIAARCHVWSGSDSIWSDISHMEAFGDHREVGALLNDRLARTSATGPTYLLSGLARGLPMRCHYASGERGTRISCTKQTTGSAIAKTGGHCAACTLAGSPGAVARSAAESIAHSLGVPVEYSAKLRTQACPLCFHDVAGLVEVFNAESQGRTDKHTAIEVRVYNEFNGDETFSNQTERRIVFAIWRKGATSELPTRAGRTGRQIHAWATGHAQAKRCVAWAGAWWRLQDRTFHALRAEKWSLLDSGGSLDDWNNDNVSDGLLSGLNDARTDFESGDFGFGYVAVFLVGDGEHGQAMFRAEVTNE